MCVCVFSLFLSHTGTPESNERPAKKERKKESKKERKDWGAMARGCR